MRARPTWLLLLLAMALPLPVWAGDDAPLIAVLELSTRVTGAKVDRGYFSDRVRGAVLLAMPKARLMTRDNLEVLARAAHVDLSTCDASCAVDTGRKLGADYIVSGELVSLGRSLRISLRLHETREGRLLSVAHAGGDSPEQLDRALDAPLAELVEPLRPQEAPGRFSALAPLWLADAVSLSAAMALVLPAEGRFELLAHVFGAELRGWKADGAHWMLEVGLAPFTLRRRAGPQLSIDWLQPYAAFAVGTPCLPHDESGSCALGSTVHGLRVGTRAALVVNPQRELFGLRLGLDLSYAKMDLQDSGGAAWNGVALVAFAGVGLSL
ncbi:MAG: hypothetical protein JST92_08185 [Deltaproteobacteria bacterium]|nr:hypothetical protein [Deltaproteobacteria bacterium]